MAFGTLFYAMAAGFQVWLLQQSSIESAKQVDKLVGATNKAVVDAIRQNRESIDAALKQNRDMLDASTRQSKAALDASIDALHIDQRPYVVRMPFALNRAIKPGPIPVYQFSVSLGFMIAGKSPAISIRGYRVFRCYDIIPNARQNAFQVEVERVANEAFSAAKKTQPVFMAAIAPQSPGSAAPQSPSMFDSHDIHLSPTDFANIMARRAILLLAGFVTYRDALMKQTDPDHVTEFCSYMLGDGIAAPSA
jgi:hypothetical protein